MPRTLLELHHLRMHFPIRSGLFGHSKTSVKAVDDVSLTLNKGETLGLVGESGCGKSTLGKCIVRLLEPTDGSVLFNGQSITKLSPRRLRPLRRHIQMVFQDPVESLNQRFSVGQLIEEPFLIHKLGTSAQRHAWVCALIDRVGLPKDSLDKFPFEFSGGQRQRIGIARAIALHPELIILDEPVSALDVSVQSQILNLLNELQREFDLSYLFIAHDLAVVKHISDRIAVMYLGKIVEIANAETLYTAPKHAYTKALLAALPHPDPSRKGKKRTHLTLSGDVPSPLNPPGGSAFGHRIGHPSYSETIGMDLTPVEINPGHWVAPDPCALEPEDYALCRNL